MADKYWGPSTGGSSTGTWDASSVTNWFDDLARTVRSAVAPTSADNVFFDANSDAGAGFTVTISTNAVCNDITVVGLDQAMIFSAGATAKLDYYGSLSFPTTNLTWNGVIGARITARATSSGKTITTNGVALTSTDFYIDGLNGVHSLGSALTFGSNRTFYVRNGTFNTANFNLTGGQLAFNATGTRTLNLGSSTISVNATTGIASGALTNLTFNADTSSIICSAASPVFIGSGLTYYNVSFTSTNSGTHTITGANTFNDLTFTSVGATGIRNISVGANQTVNGTLTLGTANTAIRRMFMFSDTIGTNRTITANAIATLADVDFRDITAAGTAGTWSGIRLGNCLGNSNITFDAGKTVYYNDTNGGTWTDTAWALSSGGAVDINNFPLAQDTVIFDNTGWTSGSLGTNAFWQIGTLDFSAMSNSVTFATGGQLTGIYGDFKLSNSVTITGTSVIFFYGQGKTQNITTAGKTLSQQLNVGNATGTVQLQDALTTSNTFTLASGTLDLNNFDLTCLTFSSNNANVRSIVFGTGQINVTGNANNILSIATGTNFSYTGTGGFVFSYSGGTGTRTSSIGNSGGITESNAPNITILYATDSVRFNQTSHINNINCSLFAGSLLQETNRIVIYGNATFSNSITTGTGATQTQFAKSSGVQTLTSGGMTFNFPIQKIGAGTLRLLDSASLASTLTFTHTEGTLDLNDFDLTTGLYSSTGSTTRQLDLGTGNLNVTGASFTVSGSNFSTAGTGSVSMNSASSKTFAGGGFSYSCTLNQGGAGDLSVTGSNTFFDISNSLQPCTVRLPANTDTFVQNLSLSGLPGQLVSLRSTVNGQQFRIVKV